jgi:hypothetical protein
MPKEAHVTLRVDATELAERIDELPDKLLDRLADKLIDRIERRLAERARRRGMN